MTLRFHLMRLAQFRVMLAQKAIDFLMAHIQKTIRKYDA